MSALGPPPLPPGASCDDNRGTASLAVICSLTSLSLVVVGIRFFSRLNKQRKGLQADDYTMFVAMFIGLVNMIIGIFEARSGIGHHLACLSLPDTINVLRLLFISEFLTFLAIFFVKLSVTLFLLKIGGLRRSLRIALMINLILLALSTIGFIVVLFVQCRPIEANFDPRLRPTATCLSAKANVDVSYVAAAISIATDFGCACLPFPIIYDLKMSRRTKISVLILMSLGVFAMTCGIVRATQVYQLNNTSDITYAVSTVGTWTAAELYVGIITGSLPACRVFVLQVVAELRSRTRPSENTMGVPHHGSGSGWSWILHTLSPASRGSHGSRGSRNRGSRIDSIKMTHQPNRSAEGWESAGRNSEGSIMPLHATTTNTEDDGIVKTVDVRVESDLGGGVREAGKGKEPENYDWK